MQNVNSYRFTGEADAGADPPPLHALDELVTEVDAAAAALKRRPDVAKLQPVPVAPGFKKYVTTYHLLSPFAHGSAVHSLFKRTAEGVGFAELLDRVARVDPGTASSDFYRACQRFLTHLGVPKKCESVSPARIPKTSQRRCWT